MPDDPTKDAPEPAPDREAPDPAAGPPRDGAPDAEPSAAEGSASEVAGLRANVAALEEKVRRQQAEFLNDVQRIRRQAEEDRRFAVQPVVTDLLSVADALHNAIEGLKKTEHEKRTAEGLRLVERQLLEALGKYGVARIDATGKPFDPALHEAILEVEGTAPGRVVVQVVRPGFTLHGRVVRPAHVVVTRPRATPPDAPAADGPAAPEA